MNKFRNTLTAMAFALVLVSCATQPTTLKEGIGAAEATHSSVVAALDSSVNAGTVSSADAQSYADRAAKANVILKAAKTAFIAGDTAGANRQLAIAVSLLTELQNDMRAKGAMK